MKKSKKPAENVRARKLPDRHLDVPSEANRDKHVNFLAQERGETDPAAEPDDNTLSHNREKNENKG